MDFIIQNLNHYMTFLARKLKKRQEEGNLRSLKMISAPVDFSSNDYLGLARKHSLDSLENLSQGGLCCGSTGSRLLTGNSSFAELLEEKIAHFHGFSSGTLFNCGYMANLGLISAITTPLSTLIFDSYIHASTHDGMRLSKARTFPFRHNDMDHLEKRLQKCMGKEENFLCVESIYSQDGSQAPLEDILYLVRKYGISLIVDEAHAVGIIGPEGRGFFNDPEILAKVVTFGKALGCMGAMVLGNELLKKILINYAHSFIYTTALPPYALFAIAHSYDLFPKMNKERKHLEKLIKILNKESLSPIQPIFFPGNKNVLKKAEELQKKGFHVRALLSPTIKKGQENLRICLHSFNTEEEVNLLKDSL